MPMPKPKKDESKDDFLDRCMGDDVMVKDYPDNDQRYAICNSLWEDKKSKPNSKIEIRSFPIELRTDKVEGESPKLVGHAALFDVLSEDLGGFKEKIRKGAFANSIKVDDIRALFNHDSNYVLGRNTSGSLILAEDDLGLAIEIDPPDTQFAKDLMTLIGRGDISGMSFGFIVNVDEWDSTDKDNVIRTLIDISLWDVSPVTYPVYPTTDIGIKSAKEIFGEFQINQNKELELIKSAELIEKKRKNDLRRVGNYKKMYLD